PDVIYSDPKVVDFTQGTKHQADLSELLSRNQTAYLGRLVEETFEFESLARSLEQFDKEQESSLDFEDEDLRKTLPFIFQALESEAENTRKFRTQLMILLHRRDEERLQERIEKGTGYYLQFLEGILERLLLHQAMIMDFARI